MHLLVLLRCEGDILDDGTLSLTKQRLVEPSSLHSHIQYEVAVRIKGSLEADLGQANLLRFSLGLLRVFHRTDPVVQPVEVVKNTSNDRCLLALQCA